ncbi:hypothetical protein Q8A73_007372 [Channa argus]|nr:hypothetical protein Q8A73_007372 [Channa argus]
MEKLPENNPERSVYLEIEPEKVLAEWPHLENLPESKTTSSKPLLEGMENLSKQEDTPTERQNVMDKSVSESLNLCDEQMPPQQEAKCPSGCSSSKPFFNGCEFGAMALALCYFQPDQNQHPVNFCSSLVRT